MTRKSFTRALPVGCVSLVAALSLVACGDSGDADPAGGSDAAPDFPEKDVTIIVPYAPGGGGDAHARGMATCLAEQTGVDFIVENRTPAIDGLATVWNAKPDGYTIGYVPLPTVVGMKLSQPDAVPWTADEFVPIGITESNGYVLYVKGDGPYEDVEDLQDAEGLKSLLTEPGAGGSLSNSVAIVSLGLDATQTFGADTSVESALAILRGEADFSVHGASDYPDLVESGELRPILFLGTEDQRSEEYPWLADVPGLDTVGAADLAGVVSEYRLFAAPPGTPEPVATVLQDEFAAAFDNGCMQEWSEQTEHPLLPQTAEEAAEILDQQATRLEELAPELEGVKTS